MSSEEPGEDLELSLIEPTRGTLLTTMAGCWPNCTPIKLPNALFSCCCCTVITDDADAALSETPWAKTFAEYCIVLGAIIDDTDDCCCWLMPAEVPGPVITELLPPAVLVGTSCGEGCWLLPSGESVISWMLLPLLIWFEPKQNTVLLSKWSK